MISSICKLIIRLRHDERGLSAVEYAVLGGIIVGGLATVGGLFGDALELAFTNMTADLAAS